MSGKEDKDVVDRQDFESKIAQLQQIVDKLESDSSVTLEDSMALFEQGLSLTGECVGELNAMQAKIGELNKKLDIILGKSVSDD